MPYDDQGSSALNPLAESRAPSEPMKVEKGKAVSMPTWWESPPTLYVPAPVKEDAIKSARKRVRQLENSKVSGQDYPLELIMQLYQVCEVCAFYPWNCTKGLQNCVCLVRSTLSLRYSKLVFQCYGIMVHMDCIY